MNPKPYFSSILSITAALLVLSLCVTSGADAQAWDNLILNQDTTTELQNEEQVAINPTNPDNMVAVWRDFRLGYRQVGWAYTFDGGESWTEGGLIDEPNYPWQSDPGVTADADGNFYAIVLSYTSTSDPNGFYVFRSTDGGVSWGPPLEVIDGVPGVFEDKEFIACDRSGGAHDGNLYVVWTRFYSTQILLRRSLDSGQTWSSTIQVGDQGSVQFPIPVVGRGGEVYVAWTSYAQSSILFDVSTDGGATFGTDRTVVEVDVPSTVINGGIDVYSSPHMDADISDGPYAGRIYTAFMDRRNGYGDFDIWVTWSDDDGLTWSTPTRVNDDAVDNGRDQFHPWLVVDNLGIVSVVFLDRRQDPQNRKYHCYLAQSTDGGASWGANMQVSTEPSDPNFALRAHAAPLPAQPDRGLQPSVTGERAGLLGEYIGLTAWDGVPTPVWTDIRNLHQDVYAGYLQGGSSVPAAAAAWPGLQPRPSVLVAGEHCRLSLPGPATGRAPELGIYDLNGRRVRRLPAGRDDRTPGQVEAGWGWVWDGRDADGRPVAAGVYLVRSSAAPERAGRIVVPARR